MHLQRVGALALLPVLALAAGPAIAWPDRGDGLHPAAAAGGTQTLQCESLANAPFQPNANWDTQVYPLLAQRCVGCHAMAVPGARFNIVSGEPGLTLVSLLDASTDVVEPLRPRASTLFQRLNCALPGDQGWRMPRCFGATCNYWSAADQALIYDWIAQGARGDFKGSPQSDVIHVGGFDTIRF